MKKLIMALMLCLVSICGFGQNMCPLTVNDRYGNTYNVSEIGGRCWMKEYLRYNDTLLLANNQVQLSTYSENGLFSTFSVCPNGWNVPSQQDYDNMISMNGYHYADSIFDFENVHSWKTAKWYCNSGSGNVIGGIENRDGVVFGVLDFGMRGYSNNQTIIYTGGRIDFIGSYAVLAFCPIRCIKDTSYTEVEQPTNDTIFIHDTITLVDTLYIYDTIYIHDTIILSDTIYIHDGDVGIHEWGKNIKVYPNPSNETIILENAEDCECILYGINGAVVRKYHLMSSVERISIGDLSSGVYFAKIIKNDKTNVLKIIKE